MSAVSALKIDDLDHTLDLSGFDLNLLLILSALLRCRNITQAGIEMQLSQPTVSRALARLREQFNDELLVRDQRSFELTPLAKTLVPKVEAALENIKEIFSRRIPTPERFALAMPDYLALLLVKNLSGYFREVSPTTVFLPILGLSDVLAQLEGGQLDLAIGVADDTPSGFFCRSLPAIPSLCLSRKGHAAAEGHIAYKDLGKFLTIRIGSSHNTAFGEVYDGLKELRPRGGETVTVPDIHTAARLAQDTDAVLVLPAPSAIYIASRYQLETYTPRKGAGLPSYRVSLIWHERWNRNGIHAGVRSIIAAHILEGVT
ncbi:MULTISPECIES: LysR family transcriptional regulator [unclassified Ensifer]|uniref:LysR family transcriptional regulator n=1 Tax=unclassified Ensifer TaxID=2633371 RepID=UPI0008135137|nr:MULTISPECIES: LysR family transcriptional regulator [unclassified Ensifer]OCP23592.1 hypothetical protein BC363_24490 [Ensifer sp. LC384]OCP24279.1 hypothetical protein BC361_20970 [Ensifer sp. LC54]